MEIILELEVDRVMQDSYSGGGGVSTHLVMRKWPLASNVWQDREIKFDAPVQ